jgi:hypothetical protein
MKKLRHIKKDTLERVALLVTIVGFPLLIISTIGVFYQLVVVEQIASSSNNIALSAMFFRDSNIAIISAIESNDPDHKTQILKENNGTFASTQLDAYLGDFETIDQAYVEGLLTEDELCTSFSYYVTATAKSEEVQNYLADNPEFFGGLKRLQVVVTNSKRKECRDSEQTNRKEPAPHRKKSN